MYKQHVNHANSSNDKLMEVRLIDNMLEIVIILGIMCKNAVLIKIDFVKIKKSW